MLRFFAFFFVFLNHTLRMNAEAGHHRVASMRLEEVADTIARMGRWGVDLFFVLSAYLITDLLLRERVKTGSLDVARFYVRRALRIWPLYFAFLALAVVLHLVDRGEQMTWTYALGYFFFAGNWIAIWKPITTIAGPLWSVSIEEQFYILWPLAIRRASRSRIAITALFLLALATFSRLLLVLDGASAVAIYRNTFCRLDPIAAGILVAVVLRGRVPTFSLRARLLLGMLTLSALLVVNVWLRPIVGPMNLGSQLASYPLVALGCTAMLLAVLGLGSPAAPIEGPSRWLIFMGRISYGLYVFHALGLRLAERLVPAHYSSIEIFTIYWLFAFASTIVMAVTSYRWLEQPFLRLKQQRFTVIPSRPEDMIRC
jgi:peptidoglycan/LPS O-acetylase OafA/YrhL